MIILMNSKKITLITLVALTFSVTPLVAFAVEIAPRAEQDMLKATQQPNTNISDSKLAARMTEAKARAAQEIDRRIVSLQALIERIGAMKRLSDADKKTLINVIQAQITALTSLKGTVEGATDIATLRTEMETVNTSYRIYALVMPQVRIIAAADRLLTVTGQLELVSAKLAGRVAEMSAAQGNVTTLQTSLDDMKTKIANATKMAQEAVNAVVGLLPDNGDQAKQKSNLATLKDSQAKIRAGQQDVVAARKDAETITKALRAFNKTTTATTPPAGTPSAGQGTER
jgi:hypothetical protein